MIVKVFLGTMQNAKKLVSITESIPYDVELCNGRYVVNAKSMLGVLSLPDFDIGELHIHTDNEKECEKLLHHLLEENLLQDTNDAVRRSIYDITVFGEILIDFTSQGINENGQMLYARNPGGAPANVAVAAGKLGAHTAFIGKAGRDMHGEFLQSVLKRENVDTTGLILDEQYFTTLAFVEVSETGERTFSFARKPGADTKLQKEEVEVDILDNTHIFHVGSLSLTEQPARDTTFYAVKRAKNKGSIISYDPNYRVSLWKDEEVAKQHMRSLVPYVDLMKISDEETVLLTDCKDIQEAAEALYRQGVKIVAVTLGAKGAYIYCKEGGSMVPGFTVTKPEDTNGAGDSFWGGFLYKISTSEKQLDELTIKELAEYARFGNAVASLCVAKKGAIPAMPRLSQVEERLEN
ncbi:PfkB family carbohydrate kinase [Bariatricus massiliensis]|uniref:PfkB family carbohydrate kinase n=1 Tax=Bariatricus massiliensis TaxID=1745713 RepID=UPI0009EE5B49|nr:PfkB family carbohydrate kinase [Bariatricus massiliensis]